MGAAGVSEIWLVTFCKAWKKLKKEIGLWFVGGAVFELGLGGGGEEDTVFGREVKLKSPVR